MSNDVKEDILKNDELLSQMMTKDQPEKATEDLEAHQIEPENLEEEKKLQNQHNVPQNIDIRLYLNEKDDLNRIKKLKSIELPPIN